MSVLSILNPIKNKTSRKLLSKTIDVVGGESVLNVAGGMLGKSISQSVKGLGTSLQHPEILENPISNKVTSILTPTQKAETIQGVKGIGKSVSSFGEGLEDFYSNTFSQGLKFIEDYEKNPQLKGMIRYGIGQLAQSAPSTLSLLSPYTAPLGYAQLKTQMTQEAYETYKNNPNIKISDDEIFKVANTVGTINAGIELGAEALALKFVGLLKGPKDLAKKSILKTAFGAKGKSILSENIEEILQGVATNVGARKLGDTKAGMSWEDFIRTIELTTAATLISPSGITAGITQNITNKEIEKIEDSERKKILEGIKKEVATQVKDYNEFKDKLGEYGINEDKSKEIWNDYALATQQYDKLTYMPEENEELNNLIEERQDIRDREAELMSNEEQTESEKEELQMIQEEGREYDEMYGQLPIRENRTERSGTKDLNTSIAESLGELGELGDVGDVTSTNPATPKITGVSNTPLIRSKAYQGRGATKDEIAKGLLSNLPQYKEYTDRIQELQNKDAKEGLSKEEKEELKKIKREARKIVTQTNKAATRLWEKEALSRDNPTIKIDNQVFLVQKILRDNKNTKRRSYIRGLINDITNNYGLNLYKIYDGAYVVYADEGQISDGGILGWHSGLATLGGKPQSVISYNLKGTSMGTFRHETGHSIEYMYLFKKGKLKGSYDSDLGIYIVGLADSSENLLTDEEIDIARQYMKGFNNHKYGYTNRTVYWQRPCEIWARMFQEYIEPQHMGEEGYRDQSAYNEHIRPIVEAKLKTIRDEMNAGVTDTDKTEIEIDNMMMNMFENPLMESFYNDIANIGDRIKELSKAIENGENGENGENREEEMSDLYDAWHMLTTIGEEMESLLNDQASLLAEREKLLDKSLDILDRNVNQTLKDTQFLEKYATKELEDLQKIYLDVSKTLEDWNEKTTEVNNQVYEEVVDDVKSGGVQLGKDIAMNTFSRLENIQPRIAGRLRKMESFQQTESVKYKRAVKVFQQKYDALDEVARNRVDRILFNLGELGAYDGVSVEAEVKLALDLLEQYGIREEAKDMFETIQELSREAKALGVKNAITEAYYPRQVKSYKALLGYLTERINSGKFDNRYKLKAKTFVDKLKKIISKGLTTEKEQNEIANLFINLTVDKEIKFGSKNWGKRTVTNTELWGDDLIFYYESPIIAANRFIDSMTNVIERAKFFGKGWGVGGDERLQGLYTEYGMDFGEEVTKNISKSVKEYIGGDIKRDDLIEFISGYVKNGDAEKFVLDVDKIFAEETQDSIGAIVADWIKKGNITEEQGAEIEDLLKAYFSDREAQAGERAMQVVRNVTHIALLGKYSSTITQLGDFGFVLTETGLDSFKHLWNTLSKKTGLNLQEFGIEDMFEELKVSSELKTTKILNYLFRGKYGTQFSNVDSFMKETLLAAARDGFLKKSQNENKRAVMYAKFKSLWGEDVADHLMKKIDENNILSDDGITADPLVMMSLLDTLARQQPIFRSNMSKYYNSNAFVRLFATLKTFNMQFLDYVVHGTRMEYRYTYEGMKSLGKSESECKTEALKSAAGHMLRALIVFIAIMNPLVAGLKKIYKGLIELAVFGKTKMTQLADSSAYWLLRGDVKKALDMYLGELGDSALSTIMLSKYQLETANRYGVDELMKFDLPINGVISAALQLIAAPFFSAKQRAEILNNIPYIGDVVSSIVKKGIDNNKQKKKPNKKQKSKNKSKK